MSESKFSKSTGITFKHFKNDSLASLVVFLVCHATVFGYLALASGAPLFYRFSYWNCGWYCSCHA